MSDKSERYQTILKRARHYLFLNPYLDTAFTRCPKCEEKTKIRKFCLVIHIDPKQLLSLNKSCRYCPECDLIIVKHAELKAILTAFCEQNAPEIVGNDFFVLGTMDRKDWKKGQTEEMSQQEAIKRLFPFKDAWKFEVIPDEGDPKEQVKSRSRNTHQNNRR